MIGRRRGRRGKRDEAAEPGDGAGLEELDGDLDDLEPDGGAEAVDGREGPFDVSEVDDTGDLIDLGGLLLPGHDGMELRIDYDEGTGAVGAVTVVMGNAALQLQPFAAPRTIGIWDEVRPEIAAGITQQGGVATEKDGPFGVELRARIPGVLPDGSSGTQLVRFVGVDGPRWFLRGVLTGAAYDDPAAAGPLEDVFRNAVVVRGSDPMPPREPIPLRLPQQAAAPEVDEPDEPSGKAPLDPFERGPEITEVR